MTEASSKSGTVTARPLPSRREEELHDRLGLPHIAGAQKLSRRQRMAEAIKTLLWVIPLTALIWIYAEREQIVDNVNVTGVPVRVLSTGADRLIESVPANPVVDLELKGPREGIDAVREKLSRPGAVLNVVLPEDYQPGFDSDITIADWIGRNELFTQKAITVKTSHPLTIRVAIEKKVAISVPLQVRPEDKARIGGEVLLPVSTVTVAGPESQLEALPKDKLVANVDLSKLMAFSGGTHTEDVPVTFPAAPSFTVLPRTVRVTATLGAPKTATLDPVPVWVQINAHDLAADDYKIDVSPMAENVQVTGSQKAIDDLLNNWKKLDFIPIAVVAITKDDLAKTEPFKKTLGPSNFLLSPDASSGVVVTNQVEVTVTITSKK